MSGPISPTENVLWAEKHENMLWEGKKWYGLKDATAFSTTTSKIMTLSITITKVDVNSYRGVASLLLCWMSSFWVSWRWTKWGQGKITAPLSANVKVLTAFRHSQPAGTSLTSYWGGRKYVKRKAEPLIYLDPTKWLQKWSQKCKQSLLTDTKLDQSDKKLENLKILIWHSKTG